MLGLGDPVPWFPVRTASGIETSIAAAAGRYLVLSFIGSAAREDVRTMLDALKARMDVFEGTYAGFCGITTGAPCADDWPALDQPPGFQVLSDDGARAAEACGLVTAGPDGARHLNKTSFILDPNLRVLAAIPFYDPVFHVREILTQLIEQLTIATTGAHLVQPPMLVIPRVFERDLCQRLIGAFHAGAARVAGDNGPDSVLARRREVLISDEEIQTAIRARIVRRAVPEIRKAFHFETTRIERYMVAAYDASEGAFPPHRDNLDARFAHRRFAVTVNLNAEDYDGGNIRFLEYDGRGYRTPSGTAMIYSASLLHEVLPVTRGTRYAFVPFLNDEASENIRRANREREDTARPTY